MRRPNLDGHANRRSLNSQSFALVSSIDDRESRDNRTPRQKQLTLSILPDTSHIDLANTGKPVDSVTRGK